MSDRPAAAIKEPPRNRTGEPFKNPQSRFPTSDPRITSLLTRSDDAAMALRADRYRSLFDANGWLVNTNTDTLVRDKPELLVDILRGWGLCI